VLKAFRQAGLSRARDWPFAGENQVGEKGDGGMKKAEIIEFLQQHQSWVLQYQHGKGGNGWWWLRDMDNQSDTRNIDGRSANAAIRHLVRLWPQRFGETNYGWRG
jgi:hypothetical protein